MQVLRKDRAISRSAQSPRKPRETLPLQATAATPPPALWGTDIILAIAWRKPRFAGFPRLAIATLVWVVGE